MSDADANDRAIDHRQQTGCIRYGVTHDMRDNSDDLIDLIISDASDATNSLDLPRDLLPPPPPEKRRGPKWCNTVIFKAVHCVEPHRGEVFLLSFLFSVFQNHNGAVRCGFNFFKIIRCGAAERFFSLKVRCGADYIPRIVRCGTVPLSVEQLFPRAVRLSGHRSFYYDIEKRQL